MTNMEIMTMRDEDLIDQILREGGSTVKFSPLLDKLKVEMKRRLDERHRRLPAVGWGAGISDAKPQPL